MEVFDTERSLCVARVIKLLPRLFPKRKIKQKWVPCGAQNFVEFSSRFLHLVEFSPSFNESRRVFVEIALSRRVFAETAISRRVFAEISVGKV